MRSVNDMYYEQTNMLIFTKVKPNKANCQATVLIEILMKEKNFQAPIVCACVCVLNFHQHCIHNTQ